MTRRSEALTLLPSFSNVARTLALIWILVVVVPGVWRKERVHDFAQLYLGAKIVAAGELDGLYPWPDPEATQNAGFGRASEMRPAYARLANEEGLGGYNRFVYPPPAAFVFLPFVSLGYERGLVLWSLLMGMAGWVVACLAGQITSEVVGTRTRLAGLVTLSVACSPLMAHALRSGNVSPLVAACIGAAALGIRHGRVRSSALGIAVGGLFKGTSAILLPLAIALGRLRLLIVFASVTLAVVGGALFVLGSEPFRVFFGEIAPTFAHSDPARANQSLAACLLRALGESELSSTWMTSLRLFGLVTLVVLSGAIIRQRAGLERSAATFYASLAALCAVLLIFSPLAWAHYNLLMCLTWGWLAFEARHSRMSLLLAALPITAALFPVALFRELPEPLGSQFLLGNLALLGLALRRLSTRRPDERDPGRAGTDALGVEELPGLG